MARRITCPTCNLVFTKAQYQIHKFTHRRDEALQRNPVELLTSRLLPVEVPDEDATMTDGDLEGPTQPSDHNIFNNSPFSEDYATSGNSLQDEDLFSDDQAMLDDTISQTTPLLDTSLSLQASVLDNKMDRGLTPTPLEDESSHYPPSLSPTVDEADIGFEDSHLDPGFTGGPSVSEWLQEKFLKDYHSEGEHY